MCDLDTLSREIAATSDAWMVPGVQAMTNVGCPVLLVYRRHGWWYGIWGDYQKVESVTGRDIVGPNLADPVTVNSLLGDGEVIQVVDLTLYTAWNSRCARSCTTRTEAIARAWIAAHKGNKNGPQN